MIVLVSILGMLFSGSNSWARVFDDESVCNGAVVLNESNIKIWTTSNNFIEYVLFGFDEIYSESSISRVSHREFLYFLKSTLLSTRYCYRE